MRYYQGKFSPLNPHKYNGNPTTIEYRSGWEMRFMSYLDKHPEILKWSSEEVVVPYRSPIDRKIHRYFVDFVYTNIRNETVMVEIKPLVQCSPPVLAEGKRMSPSHKKKIITYAINESKWKAAKAYCADRGWKFMIMTEKDLF